MSAKITVFLSILLFIAGCGVMNNPDDKGVEDGDFTNASEAIIFSKINTDSLTRTDANSLFVDDIGAMSINELTSYRIFETSIFTEQFLADLNNSAQTLADGDLVTVQSWIKNIEDANINFSKMNLLFYPILQSEDCGLKERVDIKDNNVTIIIQNSRIECNTAFIYHVMLYEVDKSIENITVKAFDEATIIVSNSAK